MTKQTTKLLERFAAIFSLPLKNLKRQWNSTPAPSRRLVRLRMKTLILQRLNETILSPDSLTKVSGLKSPRERKTTDESRY